MPETPRPAAVQPLSKSVETGRELIGEARGRTPKRQGEGMAHEGHDAPGHGMATPPPAPEGPDQEQEYPNRQQYTCPMHPEILQAAPGKCPKCGMDLVPRKEQEKRKGDES